MQRASLAWGSGRASRTLSAIRPPSAIRPLSAIRCPVGDPLLACHPLPAGEPHPRRLAFGGQQVHRRVAERARHPQRSRSAEHLGGRPVLQQFTGVEHCAVPAEQQRLAGLGGGVDHGGVPAGEQLGQFVAQLLAQLVVEVDQGLVQQHQRRPLGQRPRQRHPLLLAAGQFGRQAREERLDVKPLRQRPDAGVSVGRTGQAQRRGNVVVHRHRRVVDELLIDHRDVALADRHPGHVAAVDDDPALAGRIEPGHQAHHRGLARLRRPQQHSHLAGYRGEVERVQPRLCADPLDDVLELQFHPTRRRRPALGATSLFLFVRVAMNPRAPNPRERARSLPDGRLVRFRFGPTAHPPSRIAKPPGAGPESVRKAWLQAEPCHDHAHTYAGTEDRRCCRTC